MNDQSRALPAERYFEDYLPGSVHEFGPIAVAEEEVLAFARRYDPQAIHIDREAAARGVYGGLIASGWHTAALMMRLYAENYLSDASSLGSPGLDELRWLLPVRPGDSLSVRVSIQDARRSLSKPDRGLVHSSIEVLNQRGEAVMSMKAVNFMSCRDPGR